MASLRVAAFTAALLAGLACSGNPQQPPPLSGSGPSSGSSSSGSTSSSGGYIDGGNSSTGTVGGYPVPNTDEGVLTIDSIQAFIRLSSANHVCASWESGVLRENSVALQFLLTVGPGIAGVSPGDFPVRNPHDTALPSATVNFIVLGANCHSQGYDGESGTVTLTAVSLEEVAGAYDVTFTTGDRVTGTFVAPTCGPPHWDAGVMCQM